MGGRRIPALSDVFDRAATARLARRPAPARDVNRSRGGAISRACSVTVPAQHPERGQRHRRLCHTSRTDRPNAERSTNSTARSPSDHNAPPQSAHGGLGARRRTCTRSGSPSLSATPSTSTSPTPTNNSHMRAGVALHRDPPDSRLPISTDSGGSLAFSADPYRLHSDLKREEAPMWPICPDGVTGRVVSLAMEATYIVIILLAVAVIVLVLRRALRPGTRAGSDLQALRDGVRQLEDRVRDQHKIADDLHRTLHSPNRRGQWAEQSLANVLESSGLRKDHDYKLQLKTDVDDSYQKPDVVVFMPRASKWSSTR